MGSLGKWGTPGSLHDSCKEGLFITGIRAHWSLVLGPKNLRLGSINNFERTVPGSGECPSPA